MFISQTNDFSTFPEFRRPNQNVFSNLLKNMSQPMAFKMTEPREEMPFLFPPTPNLLDQSIAYPNIWLSFQNFCKNFERDQSSKLWRNDKLYSNIAPFDMVPINLTSSTVPSESSRNSSHSTSSDCCTKSTKSTNIYSCDDCGKRYSTESGMKRHQSQKCQSAKTESDHTMSVTVVNPDSNETRQYSCRQCNKVYFSLSALKMHVRTHTLPCKCNICGKAFSRMWLLTGHMRTHTGEKPFSCDECDRAFADRSNLRAHMQTHSPTKRYQCEQCQKTFSRMGLLTKHRSSCTTL